jgi:hypothetical protein
MYLGFPEKGLEIGGSGIFALFRISLNIISQRIGIKGSFPVTDGRDMEKRDVVLACMEAARNESYQPVQIQKLIFLFERKTLKRKVFNFVPFDFGPFDPEVYKILEELSLEGIVEIIGQPFTKDRFYKLKPEGQEIAKSAFNKLEPNNREYLLILSDWVRQMPFAQLVGAIYSEFPEMQKNSVFRG